MMKFEPRLGTIQKGTKVQLDNDQKKAQSERKSTSKNRGWEN